MSILQRATGVKELRSVEGAAQGAAFVERRHFRVVPTALLRLEVATSTLAVRPRVETLGTPVSGERRPLELRLNRRAGV
jgi:hypothetical protein